MNPQPYDLSATRWTIVARAGSGDEGESRKALEWLCQRYWKPISLHIRRYGHSEADAMDLTQDFFVRYLGTGAFAKAQRERGKFRTFLLVLLKRFLADVHDKATAQKRGGGQQARSLDDSALHHERELAVESTADVDYDRHWAKTVMEHAMQDLAREQAEDKKERFALLKPFLAREPKPGEYEDLARQLSVSSNAIAVGVRRLRERLRELTRAEVAQTLSDGEELEEEWRYLARLLRTGG